MQLFNLSLYLKAKREKKKEAFKIKQTKTKKTNGFFLLPCQSLSIGYVFFSRFLFGWFSHARMWSSARRKKKRREEKKKRAFLFASFLFFVAVVRPADARIDSAV
jgi:hypothetical protein